MGDFVNKRFEEQLRTNIETKNKIFELYGHKTLNADEIIEEYNIYADKLKKYVVDTVSLLHNALEEDKKFYVKEHKQHY